MIVTVLGSLSATLRGEDIKVSAVCKEVYSFGDIDVSYFAAALRIFTEWRKVRLIPEGYKRYAMGMALGHRDMLMNVQKIETSVQHYFETPIDDGGRLPCRSPTLRQLLIFERENDVHYRLPKLASESGASAILWSTRQLHYFSCMMSNALLTPEKFETTRIAVNAAYLEVYSCYHGWAIKHLFQNSFHGMPEFDVVLQQMNATRRPLVGGIEEVTKTESICETRTESVCDDIEEGDGMSNVAVEKSVRCFGKNIERFLKRFNCIRASNEEDWSNKNALAVPPPSPPPRNVCSFASMEAMEENGIEQIRRDIRANLLVLRPLVSGLIEVFEKLNMNDPSRV